MTTGRINQVTLLGVAKLRGNGPTTSRMPVEGSRAGQGGSSKRKSSYSLSGTRAARQPTKFPAPGRGYAQSENSRALLARTEKTKQTPSTCAGINSPQKYQRHQAARLAVRPPGQKRSRAPNRAGHLSNGESPGETPAGRRSLLRSRKQQTAAARSFLSFPLLLFPPSLAWGTKQCRSCSR